MGNNMSQWVHRWGKKNAKGGFKKTKKIVRKKTE